MLVRIAKMLANEALRRRAATKGGPSRLPPTSLGEAQNRAAQSLVRTVMDRFMKRR